MGAATMGFIGNPQETETPTLMETETQLSAETATIEIPGTSTPVLPDCAGSDGAGNAQNFIFYSNMLGYYSDRLEEINPYVIRVSLHPRTQNIFFMWQDYFKSTACFNPFSIHITEEQSVELDCPVTVNVHGVQNYPSLECGVKATALSLVPYPNLKKMFAAPYMDWFADEYSDIKNEITLWRGDDILGADLTTRTKATYLWEPWDYRDCYDKGPYGDPRPNHSAAGEFQGDQFFRFVLEGLKIPENEFAMDAFALWFPVEQSTACFNPLSSTMEAYRLHDMSCGETLYNGIETGQEEESPVRNYSSLYCGASATALTLNPYLAITNMLSMKEANWGNIKTNLTTWASEDYAEYIVAEWQELWAAYGLATPTATTAPTETFTPTSTFTETPTSTPSPTSTLTPTTDPYPSFFLTGPYDFTITTTPGKQYAYYVNQFVQPNAKFAAVFVYVNYNYPFFYDATKINSSYKALHGSSSLWDGGSGWFCAKSSVDTNGCTVASYKLGGQAYRNINHPAGFWKRDGWPGQTVASAFGIESTPCCKWPKVTATWKVYYLWKV
jgi:hypothetical protein